MRGEAPQRPAAATGTALLHTSSSWMSTTGTPGAGSAEGQLPLSLAVGGSTHREASEPSAGNRVELGGVLTVAERPPERRPCGRSG